LPYLIGKSRLVEIRAAGEPAADDDDVVAAAPGTGGEEFVIVHSIRHGISVACLALAALRAPQRGRR
jgi:hypothetical protein